jgi:hypothetical protein
MGDSGLDLGSLPSEAPWEVLCSAKPWSLWVQVVTKPGWDALEKTYWSFLGSDVLKTCAGDKGKMTWATEVTGQWVGFPTGSGVYRRPRGKQSFILPRIS